MIKVILSGCSGRMGHVVASMLSDAADMELVCGFDLRADSSSPFPVYASPEAFRGQADVLIDFSSTSSLLPLLDFCVARQIPAVLCTTGYSEEQLQAVQEASQQIAIFQSGNMSVGINLVMDLVRQAAAVLGQDFDVEIVEKHHHKKLDAPSGTALMLADAAKEGLPQQVDYVYDRSPRREERGPGEIGISSVRGGSIVGDHTVIFAGHDEVIEISHRAYSREIFAKGAVNAARFLVGKSAGKYNMNDYLREKQ